MKAKIFIIDDFTKYSDGIVNELLLIGEDVSQLVPKEPINNKFNDVLKIKSKECIKKNWTSKKFALNIMSYLKQFKGEKIVHIQHEFFGQSAIGNLLDNLIQIPLLLYFLRKNKIRSIITLHSTLPQNSKIILELLPNSMTFKKIISAIFLIYLKIWYKLVGKFSSKIIVHGECFRDILVKDYGISLKKIHVVRHGILRDFDKKDENTEEGLILYFGVISPRKGIETLIDAYYIFSKKFPGSKLVIVGKEPEYYQGYLNKLKSRVGEEIRENIIFTGFQEDDKLSEWLSKTNILILPYSSSTAASGVFTVGLSRKIPMIVSKTKFFEEETENGLCALLVEPNNKIKLSESMINLFENVELKNEMIQNQNKISEKRSWKNIVEKTKKIYYNLNY
jgi:glycosyltransferase involved in cell wall biosynthesis